MSWKTTIGGLITSLGAALMGAAALDWLKPGEKHTFLLVGFILTVLGPFFHGLFARDNSVTSEQAGANALSVTQQAKAPGAIRLLLLAGILLALASPLVFSGCKAPPQRVIFNAVDAPTMGAQQAIKVFDDYVGSHKVPIADQLKVKAAYGRYQAAAALAWDAAHASANALSGTNGFAAGLKAQANDQNAAQALADLLALIRNLGATL